LPEPASSPTLRRRELGTRLRELRLERGLTVEQVAEHLLCSSSKVSRMETGHRGATARDVRDLCALYEVTDPVERDYLTRLGREGKEQGWWQNFDLGNMSTFVGLEDAAIATKYYQTSIIPGLLQTADYARVMHSTHIPSFTPERVEELVEVRLKRQHLLTREPSLQLRAVVDEAVLQRAVGSPAFQIIPFKAGAHPAMDSAFRILEFGDPVPDVVYVEGLVGNIYVEKAQDLEMYRGVFGRLVELALDPQDSIDLVRKIRAQYLRAVDHDVSNT
jgi:transcriptional regulator with XRE-family HTH domain